MEIGNLNIKERLKDIIIDPLYKTAVDKDKMLTIHRYNDIKIFISNDIIRMLKEVYEPLGLWGQNPSTKGKKHEGVLNEKGEWQFQNYFNTNYSCHEILFNRCNHFIYNLYKKKNIESVEISGEVFSYKTPIEFDENVLNDEIETLHKVKQLLKIIDKYKFQIFSPGSEILEKLINICKESSSRGDKSQEFYLKHINDFFDDIIDTKVLGGHGNYEDQKTGIDVWTKHKDGKTISHQIKGTSDLSKTEDGYLVNSSISPSNKCNLYVFVYESKQIVILKNDKREMIFGTNGVFFPMKLKYDEKFYNQ